MSFSKIISEIQFLIQVPKLFLLKNFLLCGMISYICDEHCVHYLMYINLMYSYLYNYYDCNFIIIYCLKATFRYKIECNFGVKMEYYQEYYQVLLYVMYTFLVPLSSPNFSQPVIKIAENMSVQVFFKVSMLVVNIMLN